MKVLSKKDLVNTVYDNSVWSKQTIEEVVDSFLSTLISEVEKGNKVRIYELGTFTLHTRSGRIGRNPATGASVTIPTKRVPKLTFNKSIAKRINED